MVNNKIALTIDIEDWYHIPSVTGSPFSVYSDVDSFFTTWKKKYDYLTKPTLKVLDIFDRYDVTGTFFIVADVVENYPELIDHITNRDHEIACHGLHHLCYLNPKTKHIIVNENQFEINTKEAKRILEKVTNKKIIGYNYQELISS